MESTKPFPFLLSTGNWLLLSLSPRPSRVGSSSVATKKQRQGQDQDQACEQDVQVQQVGAGESHGITSQEFVSLWPMNIYDAMEMGQSQ